MRFERHSLAQIRATRLHPSLVPRETAFWCTQNAGEAYALLTVEEGVGHEATWVKHGRAVVHQRQALFVRGLGLDHAQHLVLVERLHVAPVVLVKVVELVVHIYGGSHVLWRRKRHLFNKKKRN